MAWQAQGNERKIVYCYLLGKRIRNWVQRLQSTKHSQNVFIITQTRSHVVIVVVDDGLGRYFILIDFRLLLFHVGIHVHDCYRVVSPRTMKTFLFSLFYEQSNSNDGISLSWHANSRPPTPYIFSWLIQINDRLEEFCDVHKEKCVEYT
jgi:hypothetical protein